VRPERSKNVSIIANKTRFALTTLLFLLFCGTALAAGKFPEPKGYVNDFAGVINPADAAALDAQLSAVEKNTTAQIAVVTVSDLGGYADVDEYAVELFKAWGIGQKGQDNGVLILVAPSLRKARIEVGYGLEGAITDGTAGEIIRNVMAPYFKAGDYGKGLVAGANAVAEKIPPGGVKKPTKRSRGGFSIILTIIFIILVLSQFFFPGPRIMGGRRYYGGGPFIGGFGGGFGGGGGGGFGGGFGGFGGGGSGGGGASGGW